MLRDSTNEAIWEVVKQAIIEGTTPEEFIRAAQEHWIEAHRELAQDAQADFDKALKGLR